MAAHVLQLVTAAQGSVIAPHSDASQLHCGSAHVPSLAPVPVPVWHEPALLHQPHTKEVSRVHESQSVFVAQSSVEVLPHSLGTHCQSSPEHDASSGPVPVPRLHVLVVEHQPQL